MKVLAKAGGLSRPAGGAALLLVTACGTAPLQIDTPVDETRALIEAGIAEEQKSPSTPPEVEMALVPPLSVPPAERTRPREQRFDIQVSGVPAKEFFMGLVAGTPQNMVVHPQVDGTVTLNLKNVTVSEVLGLVRDVYGYEFERTAYGYHVLPARLRSRIFHVDYLNVLRSGSSQTRVSSGQVSQVGSSGGDGGSSDGNDVERLTGTEINTHQPETTFWSEIAQSIQAILGDVPGRSVVVNPQSGVVVVRAMPQELREVESYLKATQSISARQVILEAKILEVELSDGFQSGINWAALLYESDGKSVTAAQVGGGTAIRQGLSEYAFAGGNLDPNNPIPVPGAITSAFGGVFSVALNLNDVTAFIELLQSQGNVQVLSSPRISTLNNQKAVIKVGSDEFFVTEISTTTVTGTSTTTTPSVELTPFFSGIALDVTPQISAEGEVILHVHPSVSEVQDQQKVITVGNTVQEVPLAFSTVRESDSVVRARSGQVVIIGGLMGNRMLDDRAAPPGLEGSPLFRHRRKTVQKTELVILLRPMVVDSSQAWVETLGRQGERLGGMQETMQQRTR